MSPNSVHTNDQEQLRDNRGERHHLSGVTAGDGQERWLVEEMKKALREHYLVWNAELQLAKTEAPGGLVGCFTPR